MATEIIQRLTVLICGQNTLQYAQTKVMNETFKEWLNDELITEYHSSLITEYHGVGIGSFGTIIGIKAKRRVLYGRLCCTVA